jgi:hypothetical protein
VNARVEEERKGLRAAETRIAAIETERDLAVHNLDSITLERRRLTTLSEEQSVQIDGLKRENAERLAALDEIRNRATEEAVTASEEIAALKEKSEKLKLRIETHRKELERSDQKIKELQTTRIRIETALKAELSANDQTHNKALSEIRSEANRTRQQLDLRIHELESQLLDCQNRRSPVEESGQDTPRASENEAGTDSRGTQDRVEIHFVWQEEDGTRTPTRTVKMSSAGLKRTLQKGLRKGVHSMTTTGRGLDPDTAWDAVVDDQTYTIVETGMSPITVLNQDFPVYIGPAGRSSDTEGVRSTIKPLPPTPVDSSSGFRSGHSEIRPSGSDPAADRANTDVNRQRLLNQQGRPRPR